MREIAKANNILIFLEVFFEKKTNMPFLCLGCTNLSAVLWLYRVSKNSTFIFFFT